MSYSPQALGFFLPTGGSLPLALPVKQANSGRAFASSPDEEAVVVAAPHAYSHSASDGRRMTSCGVSKLRLRSSTVALSQKAAASVQLTISTEFRGPFQRLGLRPATVSYNSWVTS